jgi:hypothetical protein
MWWIAVDFWDEPERESNERLFFDAVYRFVGITPPSLTI